MISSLIAGYGFTARFPVGRGRGEKAPGSTSQTEDRRCTLDSVKGGVNLDHWGGEKVDHFTGRSDLGLKDLRGGGWSVGLRPALRGAFRPERKPPS